MNTNPAWFVRLLLVCSPLILGSVMVITFQLVLPGCEKFLGGEHGILTQSEAGIFKPPSADALAKEARRLKRQERHREAVAIAEARELLKKPFFNCFSCNASIPLRPPRPGETPARWVCWCEARYEGVLIDGTQAPDGFLTARQFQEHEKRIERIEAKKKREKTRLGGWKYREPPPG